MDLFDVGIPLGGRGEDANDVQRAELGIGGLFLRLHGLEQAVVLDCVIDGCGCEDGIEAASGGGGVVRGEDGLDDGTLGWERRRPRRRGRRCRRGRRRS